MTDPETARHNMVENQLRPNRITDPRLLEAMETVPREAFAPEALRGVAYADEDIPLGKGRYLIEPLALAKLIESADLRPTDRVLVAGDVTGYAAAVLSRLVAEVTLVVAPGSADVEAVKGRLAAHAAGEVALRTAALRDGVPAGIALDVIVLTGSVERVPDALLQRLPDGGRLAVVVEDRHGGRVTVCRRVGDAFGRVTPHDAGVPRLPEFAPEPAFEF